MITAFDLLDHIGEFTAVDADTLLSLWEARDLLWYDREPATADEIAVVRYGRMREAMLVPPERRAELYWMAKSWLVLV